MTRCGSQFRITKRPRSGASTANSISKRFLLTDHFATPADHFSRQLTISTKQLTIAGC
jgi:hypothetical protein